MVGNSTPTDERHTTSNAGMTSVDLFAPGSEYPNATVAEVKNAILYSVNKTDNLTDCCVSSGVLNVRRALEYLSDLQGNGDVTMDGTINNIDLIKQVRYIEFAASENISYDSTDSRALTYAC